MIEYLCEDLSVHLYEGEPITKKAPTPPPITYLSRWKIVGNSEVKTLPYPDGVVLPTGYKRCEYLSFTSEQYFDSGILTSNDIGIRIKFATSAQTRTIIGARKSSSSSAYLFGYFDKNGTTVYVGYGDSSRKVFLAKSYTDGNTHTLVLDSTQAKIDNEDISFTRGTGTEFFNILIGTWNNNGDVDSVNTKYAGNIEEVEIYNSNQTLGNFIPCLDDNNIPCFYDTVSGTTLYNQDTGTCGYKLYPQPTEIWSCGEYSEVDGKYHILVQPQGGSIADIALYEPLRKVNNIADTVVYPHPSNAHYAMLSIFLISFSTDKLEVWKVVQDRQSGLYSCLTTFVCTNGVSYSGRELPNFLCNKIKTVLSANDGYAYNDGECIFVNNAKRIIVHNPAIEPTVEAYQSYFDSLGPIEIIYPLSTPLNQFVNAPQIEEADSYSMVISQGGKAVSWNNFETNNE